MNSGTAAPPPTRGSAFVEALAFSSGVLGLDGAEEAIKAREVTGAALSSFRKKRPDSQAPPLPAALVTFLEEVVLGKAGFTWEERIFAGFCCLCIHTRSRWTAMAGYAAEPVLDVSADGQGFVECALIHHKTAGLQRKRKKPLPLAGMALGLTGQQWAAVRLAERRDRGLKAAESCLMPSPWRGGGFSGGRLSVWCATLWLREVLAKAVPPAESA